MWTTQLLNTSTNSLDKIHNKLPILHLEYVIFFHISNHTYARNVQMLIGMVKVSRKVVFTRITHTHTHTQTKKQTSMFMQSSHLSDGQWSESTPSHELPTQQNNDRFPLWPFFFLILFSPNSTTHAYIHVDVHVDSMLIVILVVIGWVRWG